MRVTNTPRCMMYCISLFMREFVLDGNVSK